MPKLDVSAVRRCRMTAIPTSCKVFPTFQTHFTQCKILDIPSQYIAFRVFHVIAISLLLKYIFDFVNSKLPVKQK